MRVYSKGDTVQWRPNILCGEDLIGGRVAVVHESFMSINDDNCLEVAYLVHDRADGTPGLAVSQELSLIRPAVAP